MRTARRVHHTHIKIQNTLENDSNNTNRKGNAIFIQSYLHSPQTMPYFCTCDNLQILPRCMVSRSSNISVHPKRNYPIAAHTCRGEREHTSYSLGMDGCIAAVVVCSSSSFYFYDQEGIFKDMVKIIQRRTCFACATPYWPAGPFHFSCCVVCTVLLTVRKR